MLPLRLVLQNFMCYRGQTPPLELEGLHLACLCGDNGHGKSALLDAMTWALWGRSRAASDDDLVHAGESETQVTLDFAAQKARYRVVRRHAKPRSRSRSGQSSLDLFLQTQEGFRPLSGTTQTQTQRQIIDLLRLDYDTFINSAFLVQGQADLFTTARPAERKRVLGEILGLSLYDRLEERARARGREAESRQLSLEIILQESQRELAQKPETHRQLSEEEARLATVQGSLREEEARLLALQERREGLARLEERAAQARERLATLESALEEARKERNAAQVRLDGHQAVLAQAEEIAASFQQLQEARRRLQQLASQTAEFVALSTRRTELERRVDLARADLTGELRVLEMQLGDAQGQAQALEKLGPERTRLERELALVSQREGELGERQKQALEAATAVQVLQETATALRRQMEELRSKVDLLGTGSSVCPLCGTEIGEQGLGQVRAHYESEGQELARRYRENREILRAREAAHRDLGEGVRQEEARLRRERSRLEGRLAVAERETAQAAEAAQRKTGLETQAEALRGLLAREEFAQDVKRDLAPLHEELGRLGYDPGEHRRQGEAVRALEPFEARYRRSEEARAALPREREALQAAERRLEQVSQEKVALAERLAEMGKELESLEALLAEMAEAQRRVAQQRGLREETGGRIARLRGELERLTRLEAQQEERRRSIQAVAEDRDAYVELATAFGKQGVQALLIETALPEIEEEANALLSRMTEGRMSLRLESQRETRQGRVAETLDVRIADEWGTRPYELYSGGEAFRIDLALRIGLSRLLARRAGAPLPVLFIDEGFGTQDARGRDRVVEALSAIQKEFDLILVITHIQELKELFPVRIEVEKGDQGSTFSIVA